MAHLDITTDAQLRDYCLQLADAKTIGFDTEFVSEHTYRPQLCLVQVAADSVAADSRMAMIDALAIEDMTPFWEVIARPGHETIVHAGRGEMEFCLHSVGRLPSDLVDVQLAAGLAGIEYPAGYTSLISKLLGAKPSKHETRTDWRRRPLSQRQIEYAMDDVVHLKPLRDQLVGRLESLGRLHWLREEMDAWQEGLRRAFSHERWRRVLGQLGPRLSRSGDPPRVVAVAGEGSRTPRQAGSTCLARRPDGRVGQAKDRRPETYRRGAGTRTG